MRRAFILTAVILGSALLTAIARFPLAAAAAWAPLSENGVSYREATGYVWGGGLEDVRWDGNRFGRVDLAVIRHQILLGSLVTAFRADGRDLTGRGLVRISPGGDLSFRRLDANLRVEQRLLGAPLVGRLRIRGEDIRLDVSGRCLASDAHVTTTVLAESARSFGWDAPDLSGSLTCAGDDWSAELKGSRGGVDVVMAARFSAAGVQTADMTVSGSGPDLRAQLLLLGFRDSESGVLRYEWSGAETAAMASPEAAS